MVPVRMLHDIRIKFASVCILIPLAYESKRPQKQTDWIRNLPIDSETYKPIMQTNYTNQLYKRRSKNMHPRHP